MTQNQSVFLTYAKKQDNLHFVKIKDFLLKKILKLKKNTE